MHKALIWREDFPFSEDTYQFLERFLEDTYQKMCEARLLITPMSMVEFNFYCVNHIVTESWLNAFHGD